MNYKACLPQIKQWFLKNSELDFILFNLFDKMPHLCNPSEKRDWAMWSVYESLRYTKTPFCRKKVLEPSRKKLSETLHFSTFPSVLTYSVYCRIGNQSEWFILPNLSEWCQFSIMKAKCILPVIRILTFNNGNNQKLG